MSEPTHHLNYRGDRRAMRNVVGPNVFGQFFQPVDAEYDEASDRTRVGFVAIAPPP